MQSFFYCISFNQWSICQSGSKGHKAQRCNIVLTVLGIPIPWDILETPAMFCSAFLWRRHSSRLCGCYSWKLHAAAGLFQGDARQHSHLQQELLLLQLEKTRNAIQGSINSVIHRQGSTLTAESRLCAAPGHLSIAASCHRLINVFCTHPVPAPFALSNPFYSKIKRTQWL